MCLWPFKVASRLKKNRNDPVDIALGEEGVTVGELVFMQWRLWGRRWQMETKRPFSCVDESGYFCVKKWGKKTTAMSPGSCGGRGSICGG
jgi:hypothetical protein